MLARNVNASTNPKYGITLSQTTAQNYIDSLGTAFWSATVNTGYTRNITVIGRDDTTTLNQKQSQSVNAGSILAI